MTTALNFEPGLSGLRHTERYLQLYELIARGTYEASHASNYLAELGAISTDHLAQHYLRGRKQPADYYTCEQLARYFGVDLRTERHGLGLHWSACADERRTIASLLAPDDKVSTHYVIGWDGTIYQLYPLDVATWHGAENKWRIGVDFAHPGWLEPDGRGGWEDWAGRPYSEHLPPPLDLPERSIPVGFRHHRWWAGYSVQMLRSLIVLGRALRTALSWEEGWPYLKGHYQCSKTKADPWHFPLQHLEQSIHYAPDDVSDSGWWAGDYAGDPLRFVTVHRAGGSL